MFDVSGKEKPDLRNINSLKMTGMGAGRVAHHNRLQQEITAEVELSQMERNKLKKEMKEFRHNHKEATGLDEHYMECFPTYNEDDFQMSVKDNLRKRPPNFKKSDTHRA